MLLNVCINAEPDCVCSNWLSRNSLSCCTCGASSVPYVAVAIRHPPPSLDAVAFSVIDSVTGVSTTGSTITTGSSRIF